MKTEKFMKIASISLTAVGVVLNVATGILEDKKLDIKIAKEVNKHLSKR